MGWGLAQIRFSVGDSAGVGGWEHMLTTIYSRDTAVIAVVEIGINAGGSEENTCCIAPYMYVKMFKWLYLVHGCSIVGFCW